MNSNYLLGLNTAAVLSLLIGTVLPLGVGLVTKQSMNAGLKAAILAGLSSVSSVLAQWVQALNIHQHFAWQAAVIGALVTWATGELTYLKVWKPSGIAATVQAKGNADPGLTLDDSMFAYGVPADATEPEPADPARDPDSGLLPSGPVASALDGPYEPRHEDAGAEAATP